MNEINVEDELKHWGILGMHWGIRRFQNPDGSLTPEGRERYLKKTNEIIKNENNNLKVTNKALSKLRDSLDELNKEFEDKGWVDDNFAPHAKEYNERAGKVWNKLFKDLANKEYGEIANKVYDNEEDWMSQFDFYKLSDLLTVSNLTSEERKQLNDAIEKENKNGGKVVNTVYNEFNKMIPQLNEYAEKKGWVGDPITAKKHKKDYTKYMDSEFKKLFKEVALKEYGDLANKTYKNEEEWLSQFLYYHSFEDDYLQRTIEYQLNHSEESDNNSLKHWGILGMKWGIRNYQNPDGSLTPLGRIRYGVGAKKNVTGNIAGINDANSLSDEELKRMTRRYQQQADYYQARNNYITQERYFKQNVASPKKEKQESGVGRFVRNVIVNPTERFFAKNSDFLLSFLGYEGVKHILGPEMAAQYLSQTTGLKMNYSDPKQKKINDLNKEKELKSLEKELKKLEKTDDEFNEKAEEAYRLAQYWKNIANMEKDKQFYEDVKSGKYAEQQKRDNLTKEYKSQNNFYKAEREWKKNMEERKKEMEELQRAKDNLAEIFKKDFEKNANEYVYSDHSFIYDEDFNPREIDKYGHNFEEFLFFKDAYPEGGYGYPKKKKAA